jgi:hypothetical protein
MLSIIATGFFTISYFNSIFYRMTTDLIDDDLPTEIERLFILLLIKLTIDTPDRLSRIVNMTDRERDKIFHDFIYEDMDTRDETDPRNRILIIQFHHDRYELIKKAIDTVLHNIRNGEIYNRTNYTGNYLPSDLELYTRLFNQFIEYLYLDKHNERETSFSYDESGKRSYIIIGQISGKKKNKNTKKRKIKIQKKKNKNKNTKKEK